MTLHARTTDVEYKESVLRELTFAMLMYEKARPDAQWSRPEPKPAKKPKRPRDARTTRLVAVSREAFVAGCPIPSALGV